ncbi:unnamed protein product [Periconia digitata]|uniref:F-box domain-containing protein n=1 Tax=Periconia digitata TaxID=1303443 RepID=A0A9W4UJG6_9PLEO|nr:unnamed protein product [Periconia digitata]
MAAQHVSLSLIERLPGEVLALIVEHLSIPDLKQIALVCRTLQKHATKSLWRNVVLMDKWTLHVGHQYSYRGRGESDEHDDSDIIEKLYILATNPALAANVRVLTHLCHLPTPNIFKELPRQNFHTDVLSREPRLHCLLVRAIANMVNVHTLRIIYGHHHITRILLSAFLHPSRQRKENNLRKLWLESCSFSDFETIFATDTYTAGLESLHIRRVRATSIHHEDSHAMLRESYRLSRGLDQTIGLHNGAGGYLLTTVEYPVQRYPGVWVMPDTYFLNEKAKSFDQIMWSNLSCDPSSLVAGDPTVRTVPLQPPTNPINFLIATSASTLTSLNLDWILWRREDWDDDSLASSIVHQLSRQRFPHLCAFQIRNTVVPEAKLPESVYLLEDTFLEFMEAHPKIICLAWPLDKFYRSSRPSIETRARTRALVNHLGRMLVDLRLDTHYPMSTVTSIVDEDESTEGQNRRICRRRFIVEFAPEMRKVEQLKLEGGIPREEKREIIRALHHSPLEKIVMISLPFPIGNAWGSNGARLQELDPDLWSAQENLMSHLDQDHVGEVAAANQRPLSLPQNFEFIPDYSWESAPSFLHTIGQHHASTVRELKLCGYHGAPILSNMMSIAHHLLEPLQHFDNLETLVISLLLLTYFEEGHRDSEIIQSWKDTRSPDSTALVVVTPPVSPPLQSPVMPASFVFDDELHGDATPPRVPGFNRWDVELKTKFTPSALAYRVAADIAPHLSSIAKERGVRVRASFSLGVRDHVEPVNDIFDLDIRIGANDEVLEFVGPREETEKGRFWDKLEARRWF